MDSIDAAARDLINKLKRTKISGYRLLGLDTEIESLVRRVERLLPENRG